MALTLVLGSPSTLEVSYLPPHALCWLDGARLALALQHAHSQDGTHGRGVGGGPARARDHPHRLPGRREDDASQPHPQRRRAVRRWHSESAEGSSAASASVLDHAALPRHADDRNTMPRPPAACIRNAQRACLRLTSHRRNTRQEDRDHRERVRRHGDRRQADQEEQQVQHGRGHRRGAQRLHVLLRPPRPRRRAREARGAHRQGRARVRVRVWVRVRVRVRVTYS